MTVSQWSMRTLQSYLDGGVTWPSGGGRMMEITEKTQTENNVVSSNTGNMLLSSLYCTVITGQRSQVTGLATPSAQYWNTVKKKLWPFNLIALIKLVKPVCYSESRLFNKVLLDICVCVCVCASVSVEVKLGRMESHACWTFPRTARRLCHSVSVCLLCSSAERCNTNTVVTQNTNLYHEHELNAIIQSNWPKSVTAGQHQKVTHT